MRKKIKYERMFCWVRPHEKNELKEAVSGKFPIEFAKNLEDFKSGILPNDYLVVSLSKARCGKKMFDLVRGFFGWKFHLYQIRPDEVNTVPGGELMLESNVIEGQYGAKELVSNYLGEIPDLWKMRKKQSCTVII